MWRKLFALILLFAITIPWYRSHIFWLDFVDEEDNIVIGSFLNNGTKLYRDIYSQHQPAQFVIANALQHVTNQDNIFMTVKRHREFMIIWSMFWITLLVFRFGFPLYIISFVLELTKIILLGNMFLAESFVLYPLLYLLSYLYFKSKSPRPFEEIFVLGLVWFLALSLTPLWPVLFFISLYLFAISRAKLRFILSLVSLGFISFALLFSKVDFLDYYHDVFLINTKFYIPLTTPISSASAVLSSLFSPFITIFSRGTSLMLPLLRLLSLLFLYNIYVLVRTKQYFRALFLYTIIFLTNLRYIDPASTLYGAFHMLPWYGTLLYGAIAFLKISKLPRFIIFVLIVLFSLPVAKTLLWDHRDLDTDYFVHYSPSADLSLAVQIISRDASHSLWVEPVNYWVHYQNNSTLYTTMINYYRWMDKVPAFRLEFDKTIESNLPDIVYLNNQNLGLGDKITSYTPLTRDGSVTSLYLRSDLVPALTKSQLMELSFYRFSF